jgi:hypothetical protein
MNWNDFYNSRLAQYIIYTLIYFIWWKIAGFEFAVIACLGAILGEIHFQDINRK